MPSRTPKNQWRILDINHEEGVVVLVLTDYPNVKRFNVMEGIIRAKIEGNCLIVYCENDYVWSINIDNGSRRNS